MRLLLSPACAVHPSGVRLSTDRRLPELDRVRPRPIASQGLVTQGGLATASAALVAGVPTVVVPEALAQRVAQRERIAVFGPACFFAADCSDHEMESVERKADS